MTGLCEEHADIYDLAFDCDGSDEVAWLYGRLGRDCRSVLEPGCGEVLEETHAMTGWTPESWAAAVGRSSFHYTRSTLVAATSARASRRGRAY